MLEAQLHSLRGQDRNLGSERWLRLSIALGLFIPLLTTLATAQTYTTLYSFTGKRDGSYPVSVVGGRDGNFYGIALYGGLKSCPPNGCGTFFRLNVRTGKFGVLYQFTGGSDGSHPYYGLVGDAMGNLYGTTLDNYLS